MLRKTFPKPEGGVDGFESGAARHRAICVSAVILSVGPARVLLRVCLNRLGDDLGRRRDADRDREGGEGLRELVLDLLTDRRSKESTQPVREAQWPDGVPTLREWCKGGKGQVVGQFPEATVRELLTDSPKPLQVVRGGEEKVQVVGSEARGPRGRTTLGAFEPAPESRRVQDEPRATRTPVEGGRRGFGFPVEVLRGCLVPARD